MTYQIDPMDRQVFQQMVMGMPANQAEERRVLEMLDADIVRSRFNVERAEQLFLISIDNFVHRYCRDIGTSAVVDYPKALRQALAREQCEAFVRERGLIGSQRSTRTGLAALLLGK